MGPGDRPVDLERRVGRFLVGGTYLSVALLGLGVVAMTLAGRSPLERGVPGVDVTRIPGDLLAGRPEGLLALGLLAVLATPIGRVTLALVGFGLAGEARMAVVASAALVLIALTVVLTLALGR
ncbi:MAG TPA: DUF1634 domain-containing protein [Candidatus Limnocylindrales bacterium]|nr:DUF1634 domain-containing protein [Candidatus Limnocylindrales bacterium]